MKKIFLGMIGLMGLMGLWGCDKIDESEYTIYDGAVVSWTAGSPIANPVQRVYVEKYTGPRCSNCPTADVTLAGIHNDNVVVVSINHPTGQGIPYPGEPDMRTDGGTAWDQYFGINAIPAAYINRDRSTQYLGEMGNIVSAVNSALAEAPSVALEVSATHSAKVDITVDLQFLRPFSDGVTLTAALIEDSLVYKQLMPDNSVDEAYAHNHMLRKVITGFWGRDIDGNASEGEAVRGTLSFTPADDINLANSHIVVFVSDKASRKVLNCASCRISE
ncbi:MAG: Omp28-related outer membrane protein [Bacteroidales bacterium]|nr:Omp28-related outer membrane protein [Bacteroidales bacterium]